VKIKRRPELPSSQQSLFPAPSAALPAPTAETPLTPAEVAAGNLEAVRGLRAVFLSELPEAPWLLLAGPDGDALEATWDAERYTRARQAKGLVLAGLEFEALVLAASLERSSREATRAWVSRKRIAPHMPVSRESALAGYCGDLPNYRQIRLSVGAVLTAWSLTLVGYGPTMAQIVSSD
jgi:hypothetical protein